PEPKARSGATAGGSGPTTGTSEGEADPFLVEALLMLPERDGDEPQSSYSTRVEEYVDGWREKLSRGDLECLMAFSVVAENRTYKLPPYQGLDLDAHDLVERAEALIAAHTHT